MRDRVAQVLGSDVEGRCYAASEALYHLEAGRYKPCVVRLSETLTHWWLEDRRTGEIVDLTAAQFEGPVDYEQGRGCGFLTVGPSAAARQIIAEVVV